MATKKRAPELIRGKATHRRTEGDYMGVLLDTVTLDDWRDVVQGGIAGSPGRRPAGTHLAGAIPDRQTRRQSPHGPAWIRTHGIFSLFKINSNCGHCPVSKRQRTEIMLLALFSSNGDQSISLFWGIKSKTGEQTGERNDIVKIET